MAPVDAVAGGEFLHALTVGIAFLEDVFLDAQFSEQSGKEKGKTMVFYLFRSSGLR